MSCNRTHIARLGRKKYGLVNNLQQNIQYVTNNNIEIESIIVEMLESSEKTVVFDTPFSGKPSVVANFVTVSGEPNVNVYVDAITKSQAVIRTSAPITGQIHVHAIFIEGCGPATVPPVVVQIPVLGPAVPGGGPIITQPIVLE